MIIDKLEMYLCFECKVHVRDKEGGNEGIAQKACGSNNDPHMITFDQW